MNVPEPSEAEMEKLMDTEEVISLLKADPELRERMLKGLSPGDRMVVEGRVLHENGETLTLAELANKLHLSRARIGQKETKQTEKIRRAMNTEKFQKSIAEAGGDPACLARIPIDVLTLNSDRRKKIRQKYADLFALTQSTADDLRNTDHFSDAMIAQIREQLGALGLGLKETPALESLSGAEILDQPVGVLKLGVRARKALNKQGCQTILDVTLRTSEELLEIKNFGYHSLQEIQGALEKFGFTLKND